MSTRQRLKSPIYWLAVLVMLTTVMFVQWAWGGGWGLVLIVVAPFALGLLDRVIVRQRQ